MSLKRVIKFGASKLCFSGDLLNDNPFRPENGTSESCLLIHPITPVPLPVPSQTHHYCVSPQQLVFTELTAHLVGHWFTTITTRVLERTWPCKAPNCSTHVHKNTKIGVLQGNSSLIYLFDSFVDAESLYFYRQWRSGGRGPLDYKPGCLVHRGSQPALAFTLTWAALGL